LVDGPSEKIKPSKSVFGFPNLSFHFQPMGRSWLKGPHPNSLSPPIPKDLPKLPCSLLLAGGKTTFGRLYHLKIPFSRISDTNFFFVNSFQFNSTVSDKILFLRSSSTPYLSFFIVTLGAFGKQKIGSDIKNEYFCFGPEYIKRPSSTETTYLLANRYFFLRKRIFSVVIPKTVVHNKKELKAFQISKLAPALRTKWLARLN